MNANEVLPQGICAWHLKTGNCNNPNCVFAHELLPGTPAYATFRTRRCPQQEGCIFSDVCTFFHSDAEKAKVDAARAQRKCLLTAVGLEGCRNLGCTVMHGSSEPPSREPPSRRVLPRCIRASGPSGRVSRTTRALLRRLGFNHGSGAPRSSAPRSQGVCIAKLKTGECDGSGCTFAHELLPGTAAYAAYRTRQCTKQGCKGDVDCTFFHSDAEKASVDAARAKRKCLLNALGFDGCGNLGCKEPHAQAQRSNEGRNSLECPVCMDNIINCVNQCGHALCRDCARLIPKCPQCRAPMGQLHRLYLS